MNADGSHVVRLTTPPASPLDGDTKPDFSPDGSKLAFVRNGAIYIVGVDGEGLHQVTPASLNAWRPRWSPDGSKLLFGNGDSTSAHNIDVVGVDGSGLTALTNDIEPYASFDPAWSPDGKKIALIQYHTPGDGALHYSSVVVMNADGSDPIAIWHPAPNTNNFPHAPAWGKSG